MHTRTLDTTCLPIHAAPPPVMDLASQEDGSTIRITWTPPGLQNGEYFYRLSVSYQSTFSADHPQQTENDSFVIEFNHTGTISLPFTAFILTNTSDDTQQLVPIGNILPHRIRSSAAYNFSLTGVNRLLNDPTIPPDFSTVTTMVRGK